MKRPPGWIEVGARNSRSQPKVDGSLTPPIAQVWGYYTFHRNAAFSHCGVDAFMLLRVGTEWKTSPLSDSRRTAGCTPSAAPSQ